MFFKFSRLLTLFVVLTMFVAACGNGEEPLRSASTPTPGTTPTAALNSPLPAPTPTLSAVDSPLPIPMRGPSVKGRAAVRGVLFLTNPETTAPQEDGIYMVPIDTDTGGEMAMVFPAVDPETALQAEVDEVTGEFFIDDVEEGLYALVALTKLGPQLSIRKLETGESEIILVKETDVDQVIDLGHLRLP